MIFFTGEPDIINGFKVIDIKNSWDIFTFFDAVAAYSEGYEWQLRTYMKLFGCTSAELVYTLNDAPDVLILKALESESYKHPDRETPEWREVQIVQSMVFTQENFDRFINIRGWGGDEFTDKLIEYFIPIPENERMCRYQFKCDDDKVKFMQSRVVDARNYLKRLYAKAH